jgi:cell division protein ZapA
MKAESDQISVNIAGKTYDIKCPNDTIQQLQAAAQYLDAKIREIGNARGQQQPENNAILAALHLSHELLIEKEKNQQYIQHMGQRIDQLAKQFKQLALKQEEIDF